MSLNNEAIVAGVLRVGTALTFAGHGIFAIRQKQEWVPYLMSVGFNCEIAKTLLPLIGIVDLAVASFILFRPLRFVLIWAVFWAVLTAFVRPLSGQSFLEFFERGANWAAPLALLYLRGLPGKGAKWFD